MKIKKQHVLPAEKGWAVKGEGNSRATKITKTKEEAIQVGREIAMRMKTELIIHDLSGKVINSNSYGNDPYPPQDTKH